MISLPRPKGRDQNAAARGRDAFDDLAHLTDRRGFADDFTIGTGAEFQFLIFAFEPRGIERMLDLQNQAVGFEGLFDEIISAHFDRGDGCFDIAVTADHDNRHDRDIRLRICLQNLHPVHRAAAKPDVEDDEVRVARVDRFQGFVGIRGFAHRQPSSLRIPLMRAEYRLRHRRREYHWSDLCL